MIKPEFFPLDRLALQSIVNNRSTYFHNNLLFRNTSTYVHQKGMNREKSYSTEH